MLYCIYLCNALIAAVFLSTFCCNLSTLSCKCFNLSSTWENRVVTVLDSEDRLDRICCRISAVSKDRIISFNHIGLIYVECVCGMCGPELPVLSSPLLISRGLMWSLLLSENIFSNRRVCRASVKLAKRDNFKGSKLSVLFPVYCVWCVWCVCDNKILC